VAATRDRGDEPRNGAGDEQARARASRAQAFKRRTAAGPGAAVHQATARTRARKGATARPLATADAGALTRHNAPHDGIRGMRSAMSPPHAPPRRFVPADARHFLVHAGSGSTTAAEASEYQLIPQGARRGCLYEHSCGPAWRGDNAQTC